MSERPNRIEALVLEYALGRPDPVLDLHQDAGRLAEIARCAGYPNASIRAAIGRLRAKGHLHLLQRGRYLVRAEAGGSPRLWSNDSVADAVMRRLGGEYFISWHAALWHHGLIDQQSRRVSVAVRRRKRPVPLGSGRIEFVALAEYKFFGFERVDTPDWPVTMASVPKALIDSLDRPDLVGLAPVIVDALRRAALDGLVDGPALVSTALRFSSPALNRRLGFFMELLEIDGVEPLRAHLGREHATPLFPGQPTEGRRIERRWGLYRDEGLISTALELK